LDKFYGMLCLRGVKIEVWTGIRGCMDTWNLLTVVSVLAYTDPNEPFILYTDAYDIACGALVKNVHCTPVVSTAARWMMKILNRRRYVRCTISWMLFLFKLSPFLSQARREAPASIPTNPFPSSLILEVCMTFKPQVCTVSNVHLPILLLYTQTKWSPFWKSK